MKKAFIAALVAAAAVGIALLFASGFGSGGGRDGGSDGAPARASGAEGPDVAPGGAAEGTGERGPTGAGKGAARVRRLGNAAQRERLLALIADAARARRAAGRTRPGEDESDGGATEGSLSEGVIRAAVRAVVEDIKDCYDRALEEAPRLGGRLVVEFAIAGEPDAGGAIDTAEVLGMSDAALRESEELRECILDAIYSLELPAPQSGGRVVVRYPFLLRPEGGTQADR